ncbi:MAG TPA: exodeoxyribonuclease I [Candidatus Saccharimonadales bacterium]|nr:exodeoxyribonuclease I [Candidatus Saccharimonadales bacterium]
MAQSFYFFDLETSGFRARDDRIMQFAGQRTDMDLKPIGEPDNILVKITPDILPQPDAVLVHGVTPQQTLSEGISEAELVKYLTNDVFTKDTIAVGYNNIRFDNDFLRFTFWRNFTDAYEWCWKDGCSTWDLLDVVRMTRALRPEGIKWPFAPDGKPSNKLEFLTSINGLDHKDAHNALSDVQASIALAKLIKQKQPKLFDYLLNIRNKSKVAPLIAKGDPVVYTSGRYPSEFEKTTVAVMIAEKSDKSGALMYDLRIDPDEFKDLPATELAKRWAARGPDAPYFPVKTLGYNRCPAIAPLSVLDDKSAERLQLHKELVANHLEKLQAAKGFGDKLLEALEIMWPKRQAGLMADAQKVDAQLYDGFIPDEDKTKMSVVRAAKPGELSDLNFKDERLNLLLPLYKARNYPKTLSEAEQKQWDAFRRRKLAGSGQADNFFKRLEELAKTPGMDGQKQYLLEELNLYAQSIVAD